MHFRRLLLAIVAAGAVLPCQSALATGPAVTEFATGLTTNSAPLAATTGPDGNVWFVENTGHGAVGRITPAGAITEFTASNTILTNDSGPTDIAAGPDGNLWFTQFKKAQIGRITTAGVVTEFALPSGAQPSHIVAGPDGALWFTDQAHGGAIGRITTSGVVAEYTTGLTTNAVPTGIALGPDGNLWFTEAVANGHVGRITPQGTITEFTGATGTPQNITAGPDGAMWFAESGSVDKVARIDTSIGAITEYSTGITANRSPADIVAGRDGRLYFTESGSTGGLASITTSGTVTEYTGTTASSQPWGIASGPDGNVWFTEKANPGRLGYLSMPPVASTGTAAALTNDAATLVGSVTPTQEATTYSFDYGTTTSYGSSTSGTAVTSAAGKAQQVTAAIAGLAPTTTYHFRVVAANATGTTYGQDQTFTTTAQPAPIATTLGATGIVRTAATLTGSSNPNGQATTYHFEYGTTTSYGNQVPASDLAVGSDSSDHAVSQVVGGLQPGTTYHFRLVAVNASGTTRGVDQTFVTDQTPPVATTGAAGSVGQTGATLAGTVNPNGEATTYRFEYGTTTSYGTRAPATDASAGGDDSDHAVSQALTGLSAATTYHFRVVATNAAGTTYGADATFTTAAPPVQPVVPVSTVPAPVTPTVQPTTPVLAPPSAPVAGRSATLGAPTGTVLVRLPGTSTFVPLTGAAQVPMNAMIDTTAGSVALTSAVDRVGHAKTGVFSGGRFVVRQANTARPTTDLTLAGGSFAGCPAPTARTRGNVATAAAAKRNAHRVVNKLWGHDHGGRFRTITSGAATTVRGTRWLTEERCDGTFVRVTQGAVVVHIKRTGRNVLVRAGHSVLVPRR